MPDRHEDHPLGAVIADAHEHPADDAYASRSARRQAHAHHARRRRRKGRRSVVILVALLVVALGGYGAFAALKPLVTQFTASDDYAGQGSGEVTITVPEGASGRAIGRVLQEAGVVKTSKAFVEAAQDNEKSGSIQPGQYTLHRQMSGASAVTMLLDPSARSADKVTVREGLRVNEILPLLAKATGQPLADYKAALKDPESLGIPASAKGKAEGWLFPDTYEFGSELTAEQQLSTMVARTHEVLDGLGVSDQEAQRLLTVASIAEVEAGSKTDYAKVAQVIDNRLANKLGNGGKLQLDSTVSYAVGKRTLTTTAAERAVDSPYNTYRYPGLPAGPISNPGKASIQGALKPTPGPWLYWTTVNPSTGETRFAVTWAEHQQNVKLFQAWCQAHPGKC
ncbi:endolytic transglycosylase MltG [Angustibacter luteus]|uniref:Endolytic murein transglycosylase n=1 Tax=Angustibacter luteus TaxID=658456 RepID=A0ABW1J9R6_9ACTN